MCTWGNGDRSTGAEPALCGYAQLAPKADLRAAAGAWAPSKRGAVRVAGHHQRLETTVLKEPVSKMCFSAAGRIGPLYFSAADGAFGRAFYEAVCAGNLVPAGLLAADLAEVGGGSSDRVALLLASDRFNRSTYRAGKG